MVNTFDRGEIEVYNEFSNAGLHFSCIPKKIPKVCCNYDIHKCDEDH